MAEKNLTVAVVDDEEDIVELITGALKKEGYLSVPYADGTSFIEGLKKEKKPYSAILLDVMLPGYSGTEILKMLRNSPDFSDHRRTPVIMVSARDTEFDKVLGLELGADDYLSKPFSTVELAARVKAVIRRAAGQPSDGDDEGIRISGLYIDEKRFVAYTDSEPLDLTTAEFKILLLLARRKGWVFDRNKILDAIWSGEKYVTDRTVDVHVKHLREKLGKYGPLIRTVRGVGYKLDETD